MRKIVKNPTGYKVLINYDMESQREPLNNVCKIFVGKKYCCVLKQNLIGHPRTGKGEYAGYLFYISPRGQFGGKLAYGVFKCILFQWRCLNCY